MKKSLLITTSLLTLGVVTGIYAQSVGATGSIVDKMKAVAHSFTLGSTLNPTDTGLTSDPVKGKKTGDILTAGEYNRLLELLGEGGGGAGTGVSVIFCNRKNSTYETGPDGRQLVRFTAADCGGTLPDNSYKGALGTLTVCNGSLDPKVYNPGETGGPGVGFSIRGGYTCVSGGIGYDISVVYTKLGSGGSGGGAEIIDGGIISTTATSTEKNLGSNWDLISLTGSYNSTDAGATGGYIYKLGGQKKMSIVEATGVNKDVVLTTTEQCVYTLCVKLSGDSVIVKPGNNTVAYLVWKLGGGSGAGISNVEVVTSQDVGAAAGTSYANRWSEANCPSGKKIVSGGCTYPNTRNSFIHNAPKADLSGWACGGIAYNGDISSTSPEYPTRPTAYAVCGVYGGGSSGTSSSWVDIPLSDTTAYDPVNCQYRFKLTGPAYNTAQGFSADGYYNAYYTTAGLIKGDSGIFIKSSNKNSVYVIDNTNNNILDVTVAWGWRPTKIEKRCN